MTKGLPGNAYTVLKPGEKYIPIITDKKPAEITFYSVGFGILMCMLFSAAAAYLGLKIGQVFEAAIPIAIIAVGVTTVLTRMGVKKGILENVIVQSIGSASGVVVAGAIFTIPAIFIMDYQDLLAPTFIMKLVKISLIALLGGGLGILFIIPFRKFFVSEMHGQFPFPEATATTGVLVAGESGGDQAKILLSSMLIGGIYDFLIETVHLFSHKVDTRITEIGEQIANDTRIVFQVNITAAVTGMGYIIGLKYGAIICAGSFVGSLVITPIIYHIGSGLTGVLEPADPMLTINAMSFEQVFQNYVRPIGIGGIATAGIIGIIKSSNVIIQAFKMGFEQIFTKTKSTPVDDVRTNKDLSMKVIILGILIVVVLLFLVFRFMILDEASLGKLSSVVDSDVVSFLALIIVFIISFLFTTVAARAIAIIGTNPVSGMTLMTLILTSFFLILTGLKGDVGMVAALMVGGVVCTALSMAGGFITDLKIGYWIGATPISQQKWKFVGVIFASLSVGVVIIALNSAYGFKDPDIMPAPQANAMKAVLETFLADGNVSIPWALYVVGIFLALTMELVGVPPLAFALGLYLPMHLNTPMLFGGLVAYLVQNSSKDGDLSKKRFEKGTLIASGLIAGGALMGVLGAFLKLIKTDADSSFADFFNTGLAHQPFGEFFSIAMYLGLAMFLYYSAKRVTKSA
jgi:putative OPT family oligopeptide transporter